MFKLLRPALTGLVLFLSIEVYSQPTALTVQSFEYIWQKDFDAVTNYTKPRIIIAASDSAKLLIRNSFAKAIQQRWALTFPAISWAVKPLPLLANTPKFNTRLKAKEPGRWYLFLQVFDKGNFLNLFAGKDELFSTTLGLKCRIVSGANDSLVFDRELTVNVYKQAAPPAQVLLERLPSYPVQFIQGFDSIATWLFQTEPVYQKSLLLKPACVFLETVMPDKPLAQLSFKNENGNISHLTSPEFSFHNAGSEFKRIDAKRKIGGNTAKGALTLITGIGTDKSRAFVNLADFAFEEQDSIYHCTIHYVEEETTRQERERTDNNSGKSYTIASEGYRLLKRYADSSFSNAITVNKDTLASFRMRYQDDNNTPEYTRMWDGSDTATVISLPAEWNNDRKEADVVISGKMEGAAFSIKTFEETNVKQIFLNDQPVMMIYGKEKPVRGIVFNSFTPRQLKLFTILCSLPYSYFNFKSPD